MTALSAIVIAWILIGSFYSYLTQIGISIADKKPYQMPSARDHLRWILSWPLMLCVNIIVSAWIFREEPGSFQQACDNYKMLQKGWRTHGLDRTSN